APHRASSWSAVWERVCPSCRCRLHRIDSPCCPRCGRAGIGSLCEDCLTGPGGELERNVAVLQYTAYPRELIHLYKYRGREHLARPLAEMMAERVFSAGIRAEAVTCVPLHPQRLKERGFNQSERLAQEAARHLGLPFIPTLKKVRSTPPQSKSSRWERMAMLEEAFQSSDWKRIAGRVWLVIDDVYTTGATMVECARTLKRAGAQRIYSATLAR